MYINGASGGPFRKSATAKTSDIPDEIVQEEIEVMGDMILYPNPANNEVFIATDFVDESDIEVKVINILRGGKAKRLFSGKSFVGSGELRLDVSHLDQGLYQLEMFENGNKVLSKRFLISR